MKKVLSLVTIVVMMLIVLTGCVELNYEITLNEDGTADISYVYAFEKSTLEQLGTSGEEMTSDMQEKAEESGYTIEEYSDDDVEGFIAKKHIEDLSEISLEDAFGSEYVTDSEENQIKIEKSTFKTTYSQEASIDLSSMDETTASLVTLKYTINLPTSVGDNNADEVSEDGKTLTWNLTAGEINEINFEATSSQYAIIVLIIIAIVVIVVIIIIIVKKKKSNKNVEKDVKQTDN